MNANVEIKARARDWERLIARAAEMSGGPGELLEQQDTFFCVPRGRLKLRELTAGSAQLIYYERGHEAGPAKSEYYLCPVGDPDRLKDALGAALGVVGTVHKRRRLFLVGQTRIHLDEVAGLGRFVELEVVLKVGQSVEEAGRVADEMMKRLEIKDVDLIDVAYIDLLLAKEKHG